MIQRHLFDNSTFAGIEKALHVPVAATSDPVTSHIAAREVTGSGKREGQLMGVLALLKQHPRSTSLELSQYGYDRHTVARRLPELERSGLIRKVGIKNCSVGNRKAVSWEAW